MAEADGRRLPLSCLRLWPPRRLRRPSRVNQYSSCRPRRTPALSRWRQTPRLILDKELLVAAPRSAPGGRESGSGSRPPPAAGWGRRVSDRRGDGSCCAAAEEEEKRLQSGTHRRRCGDNGDSFVRSCLGGFFLSRVAAALSSPVAALAPNAAAALSAEQKKNNKGDNTAVSPLSVFARMMAKVINDTAADISASQAEEGDEKAVVVEEEDKEGGGEGETATVDEGEAAGASVEVVEEDTSAKVEEVALPCSRAGDYESSPSGEVDKKEEEEVVEGDEERAFLHRACHRARRRRRLDATRSAATPRR